MSTDVKSALIHFQSMTSRDFLISEQSMINVIKAFLLFRPDFGYSQVFFRCAEK